MLSALAAASLSPPAAAPKIAISAPGLDGSAPEFVPAFRQPNTVTGISTLPSAENHGLPPLPSVSTGRLSPVNGRVSAGNHRRSASAGALPSLEEIARWSRDRNRTETIQPGQENSMSPSYTVPASSNSTVGAADADPRLPPRSNPTPVAEASKSDRLRLNTDLLTKRVSPRVYTISLPSSPSFPSAAQATPRRLARPQSNLSELSDHRSQYGRQMVQVLTKRRSLNLLSAGWNA